MYIHIARQHNAFPPSQPGCTEEPVLKPMRVLNEEGERESKKEQQDTFNVVIRIPTTTTTLSVCIEIHMYVHISFIRSINTLRLVVSLPRFLP